MEALLAEGFSQPDLARELGVTRQVIQKMIAFGAERRGKLAAMLMGVHQRRHHGSFGKMMVR